MRKSWVSGLLWAVGIQMLLLSRENDPNAEGRDSVKINSVLFDTGKLPEIVVIFFNQGSNFETTKQKALNSIITRISHRE